LRACYRNSLELAARQGVRSIAFPAISCGAFGYPKDAAAAVAASEVGRFLETDDTLESVLLVTFDTRPV
jgi:O-acetyl-ADP-ribose deacetylase (regulator of RNase III)